MGSEVNRRHIPFHEKCPPYAPLVILKGLSAPSPTFYAVTTVHYRRWCPPKSPLRIEFPPELLRDVREEAAPPASSIPLRWRPRFNREANQSSGLLFGVKHDDEVRVLATRADAGLDPVGIF